MIQSITQDDQNDKVLSEKIQSFFRRFHVTSSLKAANAYKKKGFPVASVFRYLFLLAFSNRSMYMSLMLGRNLPGFCKDTAYRFMKMCCINWIHFTTILSSRIIDRSIYDLTSDQRVNAFVIDDSMFERGRSKKVELLTKVWDHAKACYCYGFRMLTLGWTDGISFLPVNSVLLSSEHAEKRMNEDHSLDKRSTGYRQRKLSMKKGTEAMLELLKSAKSAKIPADYVLFDSWFSSPKTIHAVKDLGYDVIAMVKKTPKMKFLHNGKALSLTEIYKCSKKRRGRSRYLLSVMVDVEKDGMVIPAKVVYVRNRNKRNEYLCLISTNIEINEDEIIRIYGKRWNIEVFFKVCKSYLRLAKECRALSYDAMTAHVAIVFIRYMMLSVENRESQDERSLGELFLYFSDELADITWLESLKLLMELFRAVMKKCLELSEETVSELVNIFISGIPSQIQTMLKAA